MPSSAGSASSSPASGYRAPGSEHRLGALAQQPPPGQRPLPVPGHRVRQHRNRALARVIVPGVQAGAVSGGARPRAARRARPGPARCAR